MDGPSDLTVPRMIMAADWRFTPGSIRADGKRAPSPPSSVDLMQDEEDEKESKSSKREKSGKDEKEEQEWLPPTTESLKAYVPVDWRTLQCANCRFQLKKLPKNRQPVLIYMGKERKDVNGEEERFPVYMCSGECSKRYIVDRIELDSHKLLPRLDQHLRDDHGYEKMIAVAPQTELLSGVWPGPNPMSIDEYRATFQSPYIVVRQVKPFILEDHVLARIPKDVYEQSLMAPVTPAIKTPVEPVAAIAAPLAGSSEKRGRVFSTSFTCFSSTKLLSSSYPRMILPSS